MTYKFKVGDLITYMCSNEIYVVLKCKSEIDSYLVTRLLDRYDDYMTHSINTMGMAYFKLAKDRDIVYALSEQLRHDLLSNYAEGL